MLNYIARRLINMIVLLVAVSFIGFFIIQLPPGTILDVQLQKLRQMGGDVPRDQIKALELRYGINDPFVVKYWKWVQRSASGDFGTSYLTDQSVGERIWGRLSVSLGLSLLALIILIFATRYFNQQVGGINSSEFMDQSMSFAKFMDMVRHLWIAVLVLAFGATAGLTRVMRANLLDVLNMQYIQTARAKGLDEAVVIWKHAVRNAIHPLVMSVGTLLPALVVGETLVAQVLSLPTIGPMYLDALRAEDMYLAGTILVMLSALLLVGNLLADLLLAWVDPRIRLE